MLHNPDRIPSPDLNPLEKRMHEENPIEITSSKKPAIDAWGIGQIGLMVTGDPIAAKFSGIVEVHGDIQLMNSDCAENFDVDASNIFEPGTVMVLNSNGILQPSYKKYDKAVVGVISGAGEYKPAIVLDKKKTSFKRMPIALLGKVCCKVDASEYPIEVGDLLTTSDITGYAMRAKDPVRAFGTVIGKALKSIKEGKGLIPILVALQ